jgi:hypothetical protein
MTRRTTDAASGDAAAATLVATLPDPALAAGVVLLWVVSGLVVVGEFAARERARMDRARVPIVSVPRSGGR